MKKLPFILLLAFGLNACDNDKSSEEKTTTTVGADTSKPAVNTATDPNNASNNNLDAESADFANQAAVGGLMEVEAGRLASEKGKSNDVKNFAKMMVEDHTKANDELKAIAVTKNITLPSELPPAEKQHIEDMRKLSGEQFDKHYKDMMVNDHQKTLTLFRTASQSMKDADLKAFAAKTLPTLEKHFTAAQALK